MKMYCIFARESIDKMGGNRGKLAAQAGHAFLGAFQSAWRSHYGTAIRYRDEDGQAKIVVLVDTTEELGPFAKRYGSITGVKLVTDVGRTVFNGPTRTCLGIGPIADEDVGEDLKALKVLL
jgi:peptidyl-tRNA hydrolase